MKKNNNNTPKIVAGAITGVVVLVVGGIIINNSLEQNPSDCTVKQKYSYNDKRCRNKTESEIKEEEAAAEKARKEAEVTRQKRTGEICLSATESWNSVGKNTCVAFHPGYFYHTGYGRMFINEKEDYRNGFVAPLMYNYMISWDNLLANYRVPMIAVSGTIAWYEGHPEIKVYNLNQITIPTLVSCDTSYGCVYRR